MSSPPPLPSSTSDTDSSTPPPLPSESQSSEPSTPSWQRTVVISSISSEVEDEHLKELFECCGPIRSVTKATILGERAVEIEYEQEAHAKGAVTLSGTPLGDRPLKVEPKTDPSIVIQQPILPTPMQNVMMLQGMQGMMNMMFPTPVGVGVAAVAAAQSRLDEIARTVYVGNVNLMCDEQTLAKFFSAAGNVTHVKFANEIPGTGSRFSFVEFDSVEAVPKAMALSGSILIDRPVKVGKANNPIFKPATTPTPAPTVTEEVLQRIREAQQKLANNAAVVAAGQAAALTMVAAQGPPQITLAVEKKEKEDGEKKDKDEKDKDKESSKKKKKHRSRSRSGSRSKSSKKRKHRSRSRSRGRRHRSRSRSRDPRDHRRFRDERSRSPGRNYSSRSERAAMKPQPKEDPHKGLFFNGYRWQKIEEVIQTTASSGIPPNLVATLGANLPGLAATAQVHAQALVQTLKANQPAVPPS